MTGYPQTAAPKKFQQTNGAGKLVVRPKNLAPPQLRYQTTCCRIPERPRYKRRCGLPGGCVTPRKNWTNGGSQNDGPLESRERDPLKRAMFGIYPRCSIYGIFTYIYPQNYPNVGKYTMHGSYGYVRFRGSRFLLICFIDAWNSLFNFGMISLHMADLEWLTVCFRYWT